MKIAISSTNGTLEGPFDPRFGRAAYYCLVDTDTAESLSLANEAANAPGGAGIQAAQFVAEQGAKAVISGDFGPKAFATLESAGVAMYLAPRGEALSCRDLLERFNENKLEQVGGATAPEHHGMSGGMGGGQGMGGGGRGMGGGGGRGMGGGGGRGMGGGGGRGMGGGGGRGMGGGQGRGGGRGR